MDNSGTAIKVGIIDSGIRPDQQSHVLAQQDFTGNGQTEDKLGHGSSIAHVIAGADSAGAHVELLNAKVFHTELITSPKTIAAAIHWLTDQGADLINMSFGLMDDREVLRSACKHALAKQITLVAASPAQGAPVYPSRYPSIIRATGDARCKPGEISWLHSEQADFGGHPGNPRQRTGGASIGCAWVTRAISRLMLDQKTSNTEALAKQLSKHAIYYGTEKVAALE